LEDSLGNKLLSLSLEELPNGYSTTVKIDTKIGFSETPVEFNEADVNRYLAQSDKNKALIEQLGIKFLAEDSVLKKVQELSKALLSFSDDTVIENTNNAEQQAAADTVNNGFSSDCLQQVDRFITGARAVGIPARILVGFMKQGGNTFTLTCWPEVYNQSYWQMVDLANHTLVNKPIGDVVAVRVFISLEDYRQSQLSDLISEGYGLAVSYAIN
jgi:transglutaminase-like putative cysteine protease